VTVLEAIQKSTEFLARKGVDSPRLQSELLLAHVLKTKRLKLYLDFAREISVQETGALRELVQRRGCREPLQHILGTTSFCGLEIKVNSNVLIPRPETEVLAEHGWKFLNSLGREATFLDFGTGSGCIAIALCHFAGQSRGWALDPSSAALEVARENAAKHGAVEKLKLIESEGFNSLEAGLKFGLIISNPPYIPTAEIDGLQEEVRKHDPTIALDGGVDGLKLYRLLAKEGARHLVSGGKMMVEFGDGQEATVGALFERDGWIIDAIVKDLTDRPRILIAHRT
jgi:release factor glutamine methyltransferase